MRYAILGPLELSDEGRPIVVTGAKQRALLAILLLNANRVVSNDRLIDALWGESPTSPELANWYRPVFGLWSGFSAAVSARSACDKPVDQATLPSVGDLFGSPVALGLKRRGLSASKSAQAPSTGRRQRSQIDAFLEAR